MAFDRKVSGNLLSKFRGMSGKNVINDHSEESSINSDINLTPNKQATTALPQDAIKEESSNSFTSSNSVSEYKSPKIKQAGIQILGMQE